MVHEARRAPRRAVSTINELGYQHLRAEELGASLAAFQYNAGLYPDSPNVWDSLGDALDKLGQKDEALASYRRAVSLAEATGDLNLDAFRKDAARLAGRAQGDVR